MGIKEEERKKNNILQIIKLREKPKLPGWGIELGSIGWEALTLVTEPRTSL